VGLADVTGGASSVCVVVLVVGGGCVAVVEGIAGVNVAEVDIDVAVDSIVDAGVVVVEAWVVVGVSVAAEVVVALGSGSTSP